MMIRRSLKNLLPLFALVLLLLPAGSMAEEASAPDISVFPRGKDFGTEMPTFVSEPATFTISNNGKGVLTVSSITLSDMESFEVEFDMGEGSCEGPSLSIPPGGSCTVHVLFKPLSEQLYFAELALRSDDPDTPELRISLTGLGAICGC
jgi:hypothetical protein